MLGWFVNFEHCVKFERDYVLYYTIERMYALYSTSVTRLYSTKGSTYGMDEKKHVRWMDMPGEEQQAISNVVLFKEPGKNTVG